jgi:RDD family
VQLPLDVELELVVGEGNHGVSRRPAGGRPCGEDQPLAGDAEDLRLLALRDGELASNRDLTSSYPFYIAVIVLSQVVPFILAPLVCLVIFSFIEGTWGVTPGKWLLGLRVLGDDLRPCGFSRALLRNVLGAADGSLVYLVGMVVIALSARQQRLGDLAVRTVVIRNGTAIREGELVEASAS